MWNKFIALSQKYSTKTRLSVSCGIETFKYKICSYSIIEKLYMENKKADLENILYHVKEKPEKKMIEYKLSENAMHNDITGKGMYNALSGIISDIVGRERNLLNTLDSIYNFSPEQSLLDKKASEAYSRDGSGNKYYIVIDSTDAMVYKNIVDNCKKDRTLIFSVLKDYKLNNLLQSITYLSSKITTIAAKIND